MIMGTPKGQAPRLPARPWAETRRASVRPASASGDWVRQLAADMGSSLGRVATFTPGPSPDGPMAVAS